MSCAGLVRRDLELLFPDSKVGKLKKYFNRNSEIFLATLSEDGLPERQILAKCPWSFTLDQIASEYSNLKKFYDECSDPEVSAPRPIFLDSENGILFMERLDAVNLGRTLHGPLSLRRDRLESAMDLSARALARYHSIFRCLDGCTVAIDERVRERDINSCLLEGADLASGFGLNFKVKPFFDFSVWNVMLDRRGDSKAYLIDFPKTDYVSTPHLDLGRFKFSLEMVKQYPPSKFFGLDWWHVQPLWDKFFSRYCMEIGLKPGMDDAALVDRFKSANIRRALDLTRKAKFHWQSRLEKAYFRSFCSDWLSQGYHL